MNQECFEREMLYHLREQRRLHPAIGQEDTVKFVFQALLGPGHLLAAREKVTDFIAHEMDGLSEDPEEPLFETLSPEWCRLNLRRAKVERISPSVIAGLMTVSQTHRPFTRKDVFDVCSRLAETGSAEPVSGHLRKTCRKGFPLTVYQTCGFRPGTGSAEPALNRH